MLRHIHSLLSPGPVFSVPWRLCPVSGPRLCHDSTGLPHAQVPPYMPVYTPSLEYPKAQSAL
jgi:hypothetical protein